MIGFNFWPNYAVQSTGSSFRERLFRSLRLNSALWPGLGSAEALLDLSLPDANLPLKALLVVAHPDDESECAGLIYRITHELGGIVDQVVVTNGEAGHHYAAPARDYYRFPADQLLQKDLVQVRRRELERAGKVLGIRRFHFLNQPDTGFTLDPEEGLKAWDLQSIRRRFKAILARDRYDLVFLLLPTAETHGHHKTVAVLALDTLADLEPTLRPGIIGAQTAPTAGAPAVFTGLAHHPVTSATSEDPAWRFDRTTPMSCHPALDYSVVANWVIAEHKTQGRFQMEFNRRTQECYWLFAASGNTGIARWNALIEKLSLADEPAANNRRAPELS